MHCAGCGETTTTTPCEHCGEDALLDGRWRLVEVLGRGGTGVTWRAEADDEDDVCVKELPIGAGAGAEHIRLAHREASVLQQLDHPQVPNYIAELERGKGRSHSLFIVMELMEGTDLAEEAAERRYTEDQVLAILEELCGVLAYLHDLKPPVVHRDVKPANVRRRSDGRLALVDFGAVRDALQDQDVGGNTVAGTFGFMAPEQFAGNATARSDLYGLGALAIALLTREDPAALQGHDQRIRWRGHVTLTPAFGQLLDDLVAMDPAARPATADDVLARIEQVRNPPPPKRSLWVNFFYALVTATAMAVVVAVVGTGALGASAIYMLVGGSPVEESPRPKPAPTSPKPKPKRPRRHHGPKHPVKIVWPDKTGKQLRIDGELVGRLPVTVQLSTGTYDLVVTEDFMEMEYSFERHISTGSDRIERVNLGR